MKKKYHMNKLKFLNEYEEICRKYGLALDIDIDESFKLIDLETANDNIMGDFVSAKIDSIKLKEVKNATTN